jgi:phage regulator Rha-like protein
MTSREIAELVESRHDKVKQSIERLANRGVISHPPMVDGEKSANGVVEQLYLFDAAHKRDTYVVVAQLSPEFTGRLVDRWQELEAAATRPLSLAQQALVNAQALVALEEEQRQLALRQEATERRLDQIETATDHFTIIGWWRYAKQSGSLAIAEAARLGRQATLYCKAHEVPMGEVPDPRFGVVKTYPKWVLDELFAAAH